PEVSPLSLHDALPIFRGDFLLRVQAGVLHVLRESAEHGHCFVLLSSLRKTASLMLGVEEERVEIAVEKLAAQGDLVLPENTAQEDRKSTCLNSSHDQI